MILVVYSCFNLPLICSVILFLMQLYWPVNEQFCDWWRKKFVDGKVVVRDPEGNSKLITSEELEWEACFL